MTPHCHPAALPRHLDQRTVTIARFDLDPVTDKLGAFGMPAMFTLNHQ